MAWQIQGRRWGQAGVGGDPLEGEGLGLADTSRFSTAPSTGPSTSPGSGNQPDTGLPDQEAPVSDSSTGGGFGSNGPSSAANTFGAVTGALGMVKNVGQLGDWAGLNVSGSIDDLLSSVSGGLFSNSTAAAGLSEATYNAALASDPGFFGSGFTAPAEGVLGSFGSFMSAAGPILSFAQGALTGDMKGAIFSTAGSVLGSMILPGIGTVLGSVVGSLLSNIIGGPGQGTPTVYGHSVIGDDGGFGSFSTYSKYGLDGAGVGDLTRKFSGYVGELAKERGVDLSQFKGVDLGLQADVNGGLDVQLAFSPTDPRYMYGVQADGSYGNHPLANPNRVYSFYDQGGLNKDTFAAAASSVLDYLQNPSGYREKKPVWWTADHEYLANLHASGNVGYDGA